MIGSDHNMKKNVYKRILALGWLRITALEGKHDLGFKEG